MADWLQTYLADYVKPTKRPKTYTLYDTVVRLWVSPALADLPLDQVTTGHVQAALAKLNHSPATRRLVRAVISGALQAAMGQGLVSHNAVQGTRLPLPDNDPRPTWTRAQAEAVLTWLRVQAPIAARAVWLALATGMREGEILALDWAHLDLTNGKLVIRHAKSRAGRRTLSLPADTAAVLGPPGVGRVCPGLIPRTLRRWVARAARATGAPVIRVHDLRHSHATWLLAKGVNPRVVQLRLGHSNVAITLGVYGHVLPGMDEAAAQAVGGL